MEQKDTVIFNAPALLPPTPDKNSYQKLKLKKSCTGSLYFKILLLFFFFGLAPSP